MISTLPMSRYITGAKIVRTLLVGLLVASSLMGGCQSAGRSATAPATTARAAAPTTANVEARATPEAALRAYLEALEARDRERIKSMVLLPADPERRRWVLQMLDKGLFPPAGAKILEAEPKLDGPVAVIRSKVQMPDGSVEEGGPMFFVQREGQWYFVVDMFEGGDLTEKEMEVIEKYL
jgi:hypothetical protein